MTEYQLLTYPRKVTGKQVKALRASGWIPAVLYGGGAEPEEIQIEENQLERVIQSAGTTNLVSIQIGDIGDTQNALVRDVQIDSVRRNIQHVDFMRVVVGERLTTEVPIELTGTSSVTATILQDLNSVEVECLPSELVSSLKADLGLLTSVDSTITVKDLKVPDTVTVLADPDDIIAHVESLRELEEEEEVELPPILEPDFTE